MKKLIALIMVIFTISALTACDGLFEPSSNSASQEVGSSEEIDKGESDSESDSEESSGNESSDNGSSGDGSSEDTKPSNAVSSITGGGDFNAGNNYN